MKNSTITSKAVSQGASKTMPKRRKKVNSMEQPTLKSSLKAYLYLLPALAIIAVFSIYPIFRSFEMAFWSDYTFITRTRHEYGLDNFVTLFNDSRFWLSLRNTATFVLGVVPLQIIISLGIAMMLNSNIKLKGMFRSIYFLPFVTSVVAISMVWQFIFHTQNGILNDIIGWFGMDPIPWLARPEYAMTSLVIMSIWRGLGFNIVILLAGLQNVDKGLFLAAKVDGANAWHRFTTVTLPMLSPTLFFISIMSVISSFRVFTEVFALFQGEPGPGNSALTVVFYVWQTFQNRNLGVSSAAAVVLFAIILFFTMIQMYVGKKLVHY